MRHKYGHCCCVLHNPNPIIDKYIIQPFRLFSDVRDELSNVRYQIQHTHTHKGTHTHTHREDGWEIATQFDGWWMLIVRRRRKASLMCARPARIGHSFSPNFGFSILLIEHFSSIATSDLFKIHKSFRLIAVQFSFAKTIECCRWPRMAMPRFTMWTVNTERWTSWRCVRFIGSTVDARSNVKIFQVNKYGRHRASSY